MGGGGLPVGSFRSSQIRKHFHFCVFYFCLATQLVYFLRSAVCIQSSKFCFRAKAGFAFAREKKNVYSVKGAFSDKRARAFPPHALCAIANLDSCYMWNEGSITQGRNICKAFATTRWRKNIMDSKNIHVASTWALWRDPFEAHFGSTWPKWDPCVCVLSSDLQKSPSCTHLGPVERPIWSPFRVCLAQLGSTCVLSSVL